MIAQPPDHPTIASFNDFRPLWLLAFAVAVVPLPCAGAERIGIFQQHLNVGQVGLPGIADFDATRQVYRVEGSGENMWSGIDAFHFVHEQLSGDFDLSVRISWPKAGGNAHRKACLMIRQSLSPMRPMLTPWCTATA